MSELQPNPRTDSIVETEGYISYAGPYRDEYDNLWRVAIVGLPEDVMSIMKERRFVLNAIPEEDFDAYQAQVEQALLSQKEQEESTSNEDDSAPPMPGLLVDIVLEALKRQDQRHAIQVEFDPDIWDKSHYWRIYLSPPQKNFSFRIKATQGSVSWTSSSSQKGAQWDATVYRVAGNPAKYDMKSAAFQL